MTLIFRKIGEKIKSDLFANRKEASAKMSTHLNNKVLVGTHHRTGTLWMSRIFRKVSHTFGIEFFTGRQSDLPRDFDIFFQDHSRFDLDELKVEYRGLHLIRDPRDRIISGCFYHQKSKERWLLVKRKEFGGLTYQDKINSFSSLDDQIMFEMENSAFRGITEMLNWDYTNPAFLEAKYEELISDEELFLFHKIFIFLGFPGRSVPEILRIAYENSIFSGSLKKTLHIRSGRTGQWQEYFKPIHKARFLELFGDALIRLGYENDNDWANT